VTAPEVCLFFRPHLTPDGSLRSLLDVARAADRAGIHSIAFGEHVLMGPNTSQYPYGPFTHAPETPWFEPFTTLGAIAAVTDSLRLSTGVLLVPLRSAVLMAKCIATLDALSQGRAEPGVGTGWQREEYIASGLEWADRNRLLDESIEMCRTMWGEQPVSLKLGDGTTIDDVVAYPRPVQARVPIWFGVAATDANVRRIARLGDGWTPVGLTLEQVGEGTAKLRQAFADIGRDPSQLRVRVGLPPVVNTDGTLDIPGTFAPASTYVEAGVTTLAVGPGSPAKSMGQLHEMIDSIAHCSAELVAASGTSGVRAHNT